MPARRHSRRLPVRYLRLQPNPHPCGLVEDGYAVNEPMYLARLLRVDRLDLGDLSVIE